MNARVLITGAGGFLGGRLAERMVSEGFDVLGLVRNPSQTQRLVELGANPIVGDLSDYDGADLAQRLELFTSDQAYSISRAKRELGYRPRFGLEEGIPRTLAWYRERGYL